MNSIMLIYVEGRKVVTACIGELLTPRALAYGVSDNVSHNKGRGFFLHTNSYSISEGELLSSLLNDKFGFSSVV
jgi:hypothetical protein